MNIFLPGVECCILLKIGLTTLKVWLLHHSPQVHDLPLPGGGGGWVGGRRVARARRRGLVGHREQAGLLGAAAPKKKVCVCVVERPWNTVTVYIIFI